MKVIRNTFNVLQRWKQELILQHLDDVAAIAFDQGKFDIDTKEDYEALLHNLTSSWYY